MDTNDYILIGIAVLMVLALLYLISDAFWELLGVIFDLAFKWALMFWAIWIAVELTRFLAAN